MSIQTFEPSMILAILPEILLVVLAGVILAFDAIWKPEVKRSLGWMTAGGLLLVMVVALLVSRPPADDRLVFGGMIRQDWLGFGFNLLFMFAAAITTLFCMDLKEVGQEGGV